MGINSTHRKAAKRDGFVVAHSNQCHQSRVLIGGLDKFRQEELTMCPLEICCIVLEQRHQIIEMFHFCFGNLNVGKDFTGDLREQHITYKHGHKGFGPHENGEDRTWTDNKRG